MGTTPITSLSSGYIYHIVMQSVCAHCSQAKPCIDIDPVDQTIDDDDIKGDEGGVPLEYFENILKSY
jgi:hypothetical protein